MLSKNKEQLQRTTGCLESSDFVLLIQYFDYNTLEWNQLRSSLAGQGLSLKVIKTSKLKKALGLTSYETLVSAFSGPMAVIFANDEISFSSIRSSIELFKKETKVQIVGGVYNKYPLFPSTVKELAGLPDQEEMFLKGIVRLQMASGLVFTQLMDQVCSLPVNILNQTPQRLVSSLGQMESSK
jgi:ribosomal protein L10